MPWYKTQMMRAKIPPKFGLAVFGLLLVCGMITSVATTNIYMGEFVIEGNSTLNVTIEDLNGLNITYNGAIIGTIVDAVLVAECRTIGDQTTCNCGDNFVWSNEVCENYTQCCNQIQCVANVSNYTPLCLPQINIQLSGFVYPPKITSDVLKTNLNKTFWNLNGFSGLDVASSANFQANFSAQFKTAVLGNLILNLSQALNTSIRVEVIGLVTIQIPEHKVEYSSQQILSCAVEEDMSTCDWWLSNQNGNMQLGIGSQVAFGPSCVNNMTLTLKNTTGLWAGYYTCNFTSGVVSHIGSAELDVALLPDVLIMQSYPQSLDCSEESGAAVTVQCTIQNSTENYNVSMSMDDNSETVNQDGVGHFNYSALVELTCNNFMNPVVKVACTFTNSINQKRTQSIVIPVIKAGDIVCEAENPWPKTKAGFNATASCPSGRVGNIFRTCTSNGNWKAELNLCVTEQLNKLSSDVENFNKGFGATPEVAQRIFSSLKNVTEFTDNATAGDVQASISVLNGMQIASSSIQLDEQMMPDFLDSASNLLSLPSWSVSDTSFETQLSANYLGAVEGLVKNIKLNDTSDYNSTNIQLQVCRNNTSCAKMVFDVDIMLNTQSQNMAKVVGMKDLAKRLSNNFQDTMTPSIVVSATVENNTQNKTNISMNFPLNVTDYQAYSMYCVFWKTDMGQWSEVGCTQKFAPGNISICECDHLTSFSVLMSKYPISLAFLDELTYVGLGVSICSLLLFLFIEWLVWNAVVKSNLSHFRHTALVNIAICLLLADCSFLGSAYPKKLSGPWCLIFVIAKHFFFLAMFFWMLCLSMMLFHQLIFVFHHLRKKVFVVISLIVGYLCPAITVGATYVYYNRTSGSYYSPDTCWLRYEGSLKGSIYAFLFPVGTITIVNMFSMAVVIVTLLRPKVSEGNADQKETLKSIMKVIVFLTPVFGGTWVLGFFMFSSDNPNSLSSKLVTYAFTIVNSLQGFFILLTGCLGEKRVRDEVLKLVVSVKPAKSESKRNLTSSITKKQ